MINDKWEKQVMKKIRFMTNNIWNGISFSDVERFLTNFGEDRIVGLTLLDMLIYYSYEQEEYIVKNLIRLLKRELWISEEVGKRDKSAREINKSLNEVYKTMCFIPVNDHDPSDSAFSLTTIYKKSEDVSRMVEYVEVKDIPLMIALQKKFFVFYDDIIGTGTQFRKFWSKTEHFGKQNITLNYIAEKNPDIKFYYLVLGGYKNSIDTLMEEFPNLKVIASEIFTKDYDIFNEENEYWEFNSDKREQVLQYIQKKESELGSKSSFSLNLPLLFQHSRASNTALSLYWFSKPDKWKELYRR